MRPRRIVHWILVLLGIYASLVLLVFLLQERLIFVGASWPPGPLDTISGVDVDRLTSADGTSFRIARGVPAGKPHGVILWFGGNGEDLRSGVYTASRMTEFGLESIVVEYPGYGESEGRPGMDSIYAAARRAAEVAAARAEAIGGSLFVGGNSLGTFSAVRIASETRVDGVVLNAPPTSMVAAAKLHYPWLPVGLLLRHRFDNLTLAPEVDAPVWIVHGTDDDIVPFAMARELEKAFAGPVEFHEAEGLGHAFLVDRHQAFGDHLNSFLARY